MTNEISQSHFLTTLRKKSLEILWEKEKMLVTSIFCYSHKVFHCIKDEKNILATIYVSSPNALNFIQIKNLFFSNERIICLVLI